MRELRVARYLSINYTPLCGVSQGDGRYVLPRQLWKIQCDLYRRGGRRIQRRFWCRLP